MSYFNKIKIEDHVQLMKIYVFLFLAPVQLHTVSFTSIYCPSSVVKTYFYMTVPFSHVHSGLVLSFQVQPFTGQQWENVMSHMHSIISLSIFLISWRRSIGGGTSNSDVIMMSFCSIYRRFNVAVLQYAV